MDKFLEDPQTFVDLYSKDEWQRASQEFQDIRLSDYNQILLKGSKVRGGKALPNPFGKKSGKELGPEYRLKMCLQLKEASRVWIMNLKTMQSVGPTANGESQA